jgi:hypothetical protein
MYRSYGQAKGTSHAPGDFGDIQPDQLLAEYTTDLTNL